MKTILHGLRKLSVFLYILLFITTTIWAGGGGETPHSTEDFSGGENIFTMSMLTSQFELNPLHSYSTMDAQLYTALYEGLISYDPVDLSPAPGVAESWEILEDGTLYRFHINPQAKYSNGEAVTAAHIRDGFLQMLALGNDSPFGFLLDPVVNAEAFRLGELTDPNAVGITANDTTLEIRLDNPASYFLSVLAHQSLVAIYPDYLNKTQWQGGPELIGNGPYVIARYDSKGILLSRNPEYWDQENSYYDTINIEFNDDAEMATERFNAGEIQWIYSGFSYEKITQPGILQLTPTFATSYFQFNSGLAPFDNADIRRALTLLLPLEEIRSPDWYFVPGAELIPEISGYPEVQGIEASDGDEAMALLDRAGYPGGAGLPTIEVVLSNDYDGQRLGQFIQQSWGEALETQVEIRYLDFYERNRVTRAGEYTLTTMGWIGDYADPMSFLQLWTSGSSANDARYSDPRFDALLKESNLLKGLERYEKLGEAEQFLLSSAACIPFSHIPSFNVISLEVIGGWYHNPLDIHPFKYLYKNRLKPPQNIASL